MAAHGDVRSINLVTAGLEHGGDVSQMLVRLAFAVVQQFAEDHILWRGDAALLARIQLHLASPFELPAAPFILPSDHEINLHPRFGMQNIELLPMPHRFNRGGQTDVVIGTIEGLTKLFGGRKGEIHDDIKVER